MNEIRVLLEKFKTGTQTWFDYEKLINLESKDLEPFFKLAYNIKKQNFGNELKIYTPNKRFPAISITGTECSLHCEHCNKKYLNGMISILNNNDLEAFLMDLSKNKEENELNNKCAHGFTQRRNG